MQVFWSRDRLWRIEQAPGEIRVYSRTAPTASWTPRFTCRSPGELAAWLDAHGDPVDDWVRD